MKYESKRSLLNLTLNCNVKVLEQNHIEKNSHSRRRHESNGIICWLY
jgi:hypothetical protein